MKILVFSDNTEWIGYEELIDKVYPDVVILAGDLTCDAGVRTRHVDKFYHFLRRWRQRSWA